MYRLIEPKLNEPQIKETKDTLKMNDQNITVTVAKRNFLSVFHIWSAVYLARRAKENEITYKQKSSLLPKSDELVFEHGGYVIATILTSVAFLESTINELFADTVDNGETAKPLGQNTKTLMANMWKLKVPRTAGFPILDKFQIALALSSKEMFDKGKSPYQDVALLIRLRNLLTHFEPEWVITSSDKNEEVTIQEIAKRLGGKFSLNPMTTEADTFFPDRCLSHDCAQWAIKSSLDFTEEFFTKMGIPTPFQHVRSRLFIVSHKEK